MDRCSCVFKVILFLQSQLALEKNKNAPCPFSSVVLVLFAYVNFCGFAQTNSAIVYIHPSIHPSITYTGSWEEQEPIPA